MKSRREVVRKAALVAACVVLLGALFGGSPTAAQTAIPEDAADDFAGVADLNEVVPTLERRFGDRFGYAAIDRTQAPSVLRIGIVTPAAADQRTVRDVVGRPDRVAVVS